MYGVPADTVASVMCDAVIQFCYDEERRSKLKEIHLVDISAEIVGLIQEEFNFQLHTTSGQGGQHSARIANRIILVASSVWQGMTNVGGGNHTINKKSVELWSGTGKSAEMGQHGGRATPSLSETDITRDNAKPASRAFPSGGELDGKASAITRAESERKPPSATGTNDKTNESCADSENNHKKGSYAAVARGGATSHVKKREPDSDDVAGKHGDAASGVDDPMCPICRDVISKAKTLPKCKHSFCEACINKSLSHKQECPLCRMVYGEVRGNQPTNGYMNISTYLGVKLDGYPHGAIVIDYYFPDGIQAVSFTAMIDSSSYMWCFRVVNQSL